MTDLHGVDGERRMVTNTMVLVSSRPDDQKAYGRGGCELLEQGVQDDWPELTDPPVDFILLDIEWTNGGSCLGMALLPRLRL
jgi:hypothetical protein